MKYFQIFFAILIVLFNIIKTNTSFLKKNIFYNTKSYNNILRYDNQLRAKRAIRIKQNNVKWEFPIKYWIDPTSNYDETIIDDALKDISNNTCITWQKEDSEIYNTPGLNVRNRNLCASFTGRSSDNTSQEISFTPECIYKGRLQHEFSHALGLIHEHRRHDRDNYVKISFENVNSKDIKKMKSFESGELLTYNISYDYGSQLHDDSKIYSKDGSPTIKTKDPNYQNTIGQDNGLQFNDFKQLNLYYCADKCSGKKQICKNGGYLNPKNCNKCKCPPHYGGIDCTKLKTGEKCGKVLLKAYSYKKLLKIKGIKKCYYYILTSSKNKIQLTIEDYNLPEPEKNNTCFRGRGLEILYRKDPSVVGAMFCGKNKKATMKSEKNKISIYYVGTNNNNFAELSYKIIKK